MQLYEARFDLIQTAYYQESIQKLIDISVDEEDKFNGLTGKELRENLEWEDIGEVDGVDTPDAMIQYNQVRRNFTIKIYHKGFDRWLKVGETPPEYTETILYYMSGRFLIWCSFTGGKFKTINENNRVTNYTKPYGINMLLKVYDK